jgi:hypothetical protein
MFAPTYFAPTYFAPTYFASGADNGADNPEQDIRASIVSLLKADPIISATVGPRVYPGLIPPSGDFPCVVVFLEDYAPGRCLSGDDGTAVARIRIECFADRLRSDSKLRRRAALVLGDYRGILGGIEILWIKQVNEVDDPGFAGDGSERIIFKIGQVFRVKLRALIPIH